MIDSHCHLNDPQFGPDASDVVARAVAADVDRMLVAGYDAASSARARKLAASHPEIYVALGLHPHDAKYALEHPDWCEKLEQDLMEEPRAIAVGEMGLDFHYEYSEPRVQRDVFRQQIRLAHRLGLPVTIHSRAAEDEVIAILTQEGVPASGAVLHAFTGTREQARAAVELGLYIGVTGMVTFKKSDELRRMIMAAGLDSLLLETDCPYLAPVPHRGKRNEPSYLGAVRDSLAGLFGLSAEEVERKTVANTLRVYARMKGGEL